MHKMWQEWKKRNLIHVFRQPFYKYKIEYYDVHIGPFSLQKYAQTQKIWVIWK